VAPRVAAELPDAACVHRREGAVHGPGRRRFDWSSHRGRLRLDRLHRRGADPERRSRRRYARRAGPV